MAAVPGIGKRNISTKINLGQEPRDTSKTFLDLEDGAFKPTVGEGVLFVEGQSTLVGEETIPIFRNDLLYVFG